MKKIWTLLSMLIALLLIGCNEASSPLSVSEPDTLDTLAIDSVDSIIDTIADTVAIDTTPVVQDSMLETVSVSLMSDVRANSNYNYRTNDTVTVVSSSGTSVSDSVIRLGEIPPFNQRYALIAEADSVRAFWQFPLTDDTCAHDAYCSVTYSVRVKPTLVRATEKISFGSTVLCQTYRYHAMYGDGGTEVMDNSVPVLMLYNNESRVGWKYNKKLPINDGHRYGATVSCSIIEAGELFISPETDTIVDRIDFKVTSHGGGFMFIKGGLKVTAK